MSSHLVCLSQSSGLAISTHEEHNWSASVNLMTKARTPNSAGMYSVNKIDIHCSKL